MLRIGFIVILGVIVFVSSVWYLLRVPGISNPDVIHALRAVRIAYYQSKVAGGYWNDEMVNQGKKMAHLPLQDRLDFYRTILVEYDLETETAILFVELLGTDSAALRTDLLHIKSSESYGKMQETERKRIEAWLEYLKRLQAIGTAPAY
ncbi:MAG: hypothetical protein LLG01_16955 [Planctomycetaceae bacterium]|nr:hypothetical protein [Planctomycetaceae bacterium]